MKVLDVHPNTVRFHLDALEAAEAVVRSDRRSGGRGRPSAVYSATPMATWSGQRDPALLGRILLDAAVDDADVDPWEAGRRWGRNHSADTTPATVREAISRQLHQTGFDPTETLGTNSDDGQTRFALHNCVFADFFGTHQQAVCALHAGMLEGIREAADADQSYSVELHPFVEPFSCSVTLRGRGDEPASQ